MNKARSSSWINQFITTHQTESYEAISNLLKEEGVEISTEAVRTRYRSLGLPPKKITSQSLTLTPEQELERDLKIGHIVDKSKKTEEKYKILQSQVSTLQRELEANKSIKEVTTYKISTPKGNRTAATAVVLASDFHSEEKVDPTTIDGLNEFSLDTAKKRIDTFFVNVKRLIDSKQKSIEIKDLILALLGDFISGNIHEEIVESTVLPPVEAIMNVQNHIASGIQYLLDNTNVNLIIPCHSGNHGRTTKTIHQATERGNSLEYFMYHALANHFRSSKRVTFLISSGYHSYVDVAGFKIRFHHGHNLNYSGGVGGITVPARKAISQWNKARPADLDCFGHFHQLLWCGNFVCNGSLIGYNAYALSIKADFEKPRQAFFLVDHDRKEVTDFSPVWLD